jgi:Rrf2 family transcriptional regulator, iron-sulfur cluster assembly transcription factor
MLVISKKTLFAIEAVLDIACNAGEKPVRSSEISERQGIPNRYLEPVMQDLVRAGILNGIRGPRGGYRLGRESGEIDLAEIEAVTERSDTQAEHADEHPHTRLGTEIVQPLCDDLAQRWAKQLEKITIAELTGRMGRNRTASAA